MSRSTHMQLLYFLFGLQMLLSSMLLSNFWEIKLSQRWSNIPTLALVTSKKICKTLQFKLRFRCVKQKENNKNSTRLPSNLRKVRKMTVQISKEKKVQKARKEMALKRRNRKRKRKRKKKQLKNN